LQEEEEKELIIIKTGLKLLLMETPQLQKKVFLNFKKKKWWELKKQ
jgi:hypothetical protein